MATEHCVFLHAQPEQSWAHCDQLHEHHNAHWREHCVVLSTLRTVFRCIALICSHRHIGSSLFCVSSFPSMVIGMRTCSWVFSSSCLSTSSLSPSTSSWFLPWCLTRIPWKIPCATPASGAWSAWTMSHPTQFMSQWHRARRHQWAEPRDLSDIYFQNTLEDTASLINVPDVDDDELAEFLAVVVDRTGQPFEVRSNSDHFFLWRPKREKCSESVSFSHST